MAAHDVAGRTANGGKPLGSAAAAGYAAVECVPLTAESSSVSWLSGQKITLSPVGFDDCTEPELAAKLSAAAYTHLLVPAAGSGGEWLASHGTAEGLQLVGQFGDTDVFAVTAAAPQVYTWALLAFYPREFDREWTWRWMASRAEWVVVNTTAHPLVATADVELASFPSTRLMALELDAKEVQSLTVASVHRRLEIGPMRLTPGRHTLAFVPAVAPGSPATSCTTTISAPSRLQSARGIGRSLETPE